MIGKVVVSCAKLGMLSHDLRSYAESLLSFSVSTDHCPIYQCWESYHCSPIPCSADFQSVLIPPTCKYCHLRIGVCQPNLNRLVQVADDIVHLERVNPRQALGG